MKIQWKTYLLENGKIDDDGTNDLVGKWDGYYVDVVGNLDQTKWSIYINNKRIFENLPSREIARETIEKLIVEHGIANFLSGKYLTSLN